MSKLELDWFLVVHGLPGVVDVREQFPLLDLEETLAIAERAGIEHPADPKTREVIVVTTDLVATFVDGFRERERAISVKPASELANQRVLEKLEIERVFWESRNVPWGIATERELPQPLLRNLRWLHPLRELTDEPGACEWLSRARRFLEARLSERGQSLASITADCDAYLNLKSGMALAAARHFIAAGHWQVDLTVEIDPRKILKVVKFELKDEPLR